jgi:hypothetical protein
MKATDHVLDFFSGSRLLAVVDRMIPKWTRGGL